MQQHNNLNWSMKNNWIKVIGLMTLFLMSCAAQESMKEMANEEIELEEEVEEKIASDEQHKESPTEALDNTNESLVITEQYIGGVNLQSINGNNIEEILMANFPNATIKKEIGKHDGPDFDLFSVQEGNRKLFEVFMDFNNPKNVWMIRVSNTDFTDEFNVSVGTTVKELMALRSGLKFNADLHANVYASCENSPISYKLKGDFKSNEDGSFADENFYMTTDQVSEMTVESIIWTK